ncbi:hypothetical protein [Thiomonas sp. FB-6]|uniref:hypothetical protein n=1 Tax=Thiomonas sp. FB-6 TaxID=1158291 RepID=UPI00037C8296|nr:hypothetical protein [Thiomonas sp. FB-6]
MNTLGNPATALKQGIAVAAVVILSIPGVLTALSPIAMSLASAGAPGAALSHVAGAARSWNGPRAG